MNGSVSKAESESGVTGTALTGTVTVTGTTITGTVTVTVPSPATADNHLIR